MTLAVAQGDTKAPPGAKTKDADNDAKAAEAPPKKKGRMSRSKIRRLALRDQKRARLAAAAPEAANAAPLSEQPQQPEAATHQGEVLENMQVELLCMLCMLCFAQLECMLFLNAACVNTTGSNSVLQNSCSS